MLASYCEKLVGNQGLLALKSCWARLAVLCFETAQVLFPLLVRLVLVILRVASILDFPNANCLRRLAVSSCWKASRTGPGAKIAFQEYSSSCHSVKKDFAASTPL